MKVSKFHYCTNLLCMYELMGCAMAIEHDILQLLGKAEVQEEYRRRMKDPKPVQWVSASEAPVKDVVIKSGDVDLGIFPIPKHHWLDSGRYITAGGTILKDIDSGVPNVGIYRCEVKDKNKISTKPARLHQRSLGGRAPEGGHRHRPEDVRNGRDQGRHGEHRLAQGRSDRRP